MPPIHQSMVHVDRHRQQPLAIVKRDFAKGDLRDTVPEGEAAGMGYRGKFDPGQGRVVDHVFAGNGRFEAFGMPYPLHLDPRIDQKGVKILLEVHIRKAKGAI